MRESAHAVIGQPSARPGDPRRGSSPEVERDGQDSLSLRSEARRKAIHLAMTAVPVTVWFLPWEWALLLLLLGLTVALTVEVARSRSRWVRHRFLLRTRRLLRRRERSAVSGATYMAAGFLLVFVLFPRPVAVLAMLYLTLGDLAAAVVGKRWGRHRIAGGKSLEGFAACLVVNVTAGLLLPGIGWVPALVGGGAAAAIELAPLRMDDNLTVPLGGAAAIVLSTAILG